ncbi:amidohydrolase family protein [Streptomyces sp. NPDC057424]|uniref:amidohydrolase family protein n=1 Tax=Streptomyces sp. NPDC057424 TaxID=3346127 RepID=UPI0036ABCC05
MMTTGSSVSPLAADTSRRRLLAAAAGAAAGTAALAAPPAAAQAATSTSAGTAAGRPGRGMKVIAVEEAFSVPELIPWPGEARMPPGWGEEWGRRLADFTELRLADMDEHGVDMQILSLTSPGVEAIKDPAEAVATARRVNDHLADVVAAHPTRFAGFAALPLQDPKAAVAELRRAVEQLGLKGVLHNDHVQGHYLDEPQFRPVWAELERLGVTLYLHPALFPADQWRVFQGHPVLSGPSWGWTAQVGAHALRIIYGGVFDEFPGASATLGHMGELLPFQLARLDSRYQQADPKSRPRHLPSHYLRHNLYATTSGVFSHAALLGAVQAIGADRLLFAVDYPYESTAEAAEFLRTAPFSRADLTRIAHRNAAHLLNL